jgi:hypothetical protein
MGRVAGVMARADAARDADPGEPGICSPGPGRSRAVSHQSADQSTNPVGADAFRRPACLVAGCPCKDARIVSHRRAAFFASLSQARGETADRRVEPDPGWRLPSPLDIGLEIHSAP